MNGGHLDRSIAMHGLMSTTDTRTGQIQHLKAALTDGNVSALESNNIIILQMA